MNALIKIPPRILIIGGGPAGAACAIRLRQLDLPVDVIEKQQFPRPKVCGCCIGGIGLAMLDQLNVKEEAIRRGTPTDRWHGSLESRSIRLALPGGLAISREELDPLLLSTAAALSANVIVRQSATIARVNDDGVDVRIDDGDQSRIERYQVVIVAAGLRVGGVNELLPWTQTPAGPFGVSLMADIDHVDSGVIYMACDDDGYVGIVRLADGRVDVAGALASGHVKSKTAASGGTTPLDRVNGILDRSEFAFGPLCNVSPVLTTPPLRRSRRAGNGRVIAIGDAAGYVEPFTGEGMTWAMQSGIAAANRLATLIDDDRSPRGLDRLGAAWQADLDALLRGKKRTCRWVTDALRRPVARKFAARTLATFPSLARPLLASLNRVPQDQRSALR